MAYQMFHIWQTLIEKTLETFPAAALVTPDGELLVSRYQSLADIGTLPSAALTCHQYFQLGLRDVVIINDPYSGGSLLSSVNLVTAVHFDGTAPIGTAPEALLVVRIPFKPRVALVPTVEKEGVRIPPTPIVSKGILNEELLDAICAHPMAPMHFKVGIERGLGLLKSAVGEIGRLRSLTGQTLNRRWAKDWLQAAQVRFQEQIQDLSQGNAKTELQISLKSKLALAIEIKDKHISFNFTGSGMPDQYALSDAATLGACVGALVAALNKPIPMNAGVLRSVDVIAPIGSIVHARYPAPVFMGFTDGTTLVATLVLKLLGQIDKKMSMAQSGVGQCSFEIDFGNGLYYYDDLEPGTAGSERGKGRDALDIWRRSHLHRSIEVGEKLYPMSVHSTALRLESGGSGNHPGGNGQTKIIEVRQPAKLKWVLNKGLIRPEGSAGGRAAAVAEIFVQKVNQDKNELGDHGELNLAPGDRVIVHSAGGGGFGPAPDLD